MMFFMMMLIIEHVVYETELRDLRISIIERIIEHHQHHHDVLHDAVDYRTCSIIHGAARPANFHYKTYYRTSDVL